MFEQLKTLDVRVEANIAYLTFNRPKAMNTYNMTMGEELPDCVETIAEDDNIKVCVIQGANGIFMAGGDVEFLKLASADTAESTTQAIRSLNEAIMSIQSMDKLVVAAVEGACAGAGLSIMLACDLAYCASGTKFNSAYVNLGLSPDGGMSYTLPRIIGYKKALELILLSEPFGAQDAYELGLVTKVLAQEHFANQISQIVCELAKKPKRAVASIKSMLHSSINNSLEQQLALELENFVECTKTNDFKLGVEAFLNKSKAKFGE